MWHGQLAGRRRLMQHSCSRTEAREETARDRLGMLCDQSGRSTKAAGTGLYLEAALRTDIAPNNTPQRARAVSQEYFL